LKATDVFGDFTAASGLDDEGIDRTGGGGKGSAAYALNDNAIRRETANLPELIFIFGFS
jgi:hypothetical protein